MTRRPVLTLIGAADALDDRVAAHLALRGYDVRAGSPDGGEGAGADLVVVDLDGLPEGLAALRRLRDRDPAAAVLALTASDDPIDRIAGLETGADDVLVKPVEPRELAARIGGILDRRGIGRREIVRLEHATVDLTASCLMRFGAPPERLGPGEVVLIRAFARNPNRLLTRNELLDLAPAESHDAGDRSIDTRVARLRRKLDTESIATVRGHGYRFTPPLDGSAAPAGTEAPARGADR